MELTLRALRSVIREAIGDRTWPGDKAHLICWVLAQSAEPMARPDVMRRVHELEGLEPEAFKPTSNHDYWAPPMVRQHDWESDPNNPEGPYIRTNPRMVPNKRPHTRYSVLMRGFVKVAGKQGNQLLYELTPEGQKLAGETDEWIKSRPDLFPDLAPSA